MGEACECPYRRPITNWCISSDNALAFEPKQAEGAFELTVHDPHLPQASTVFIFRKVGELGRLVKLRQLRFERGPPQLR